MSPLYQQRLTAIADNGGGILLTAGKRGIEKECLRISPDGFVSQSMHPVALGSALTNRFITTDYSEALLEFVTPPERSSWAATQFLCDVHQFTYAAIGDEILWPFSMPCRLRSQDDIPVAQYGTSNVGRAKTIYRNGLGHRYGRYMQAIAGIHFNYSVPDKYWDLLAQTELQGGDLKALKSERYLGLVRNVRRLDWLLFYLFGASPAICRSFLAGAETDLEQLDNGTCYGRWATSLRMSDLGYQNSSQSALVVSVNSLDEYVRDLSAALISPDAGYVKLGVKKEGEYLQLNANRLQVENEFYSSVRPKRVVLEGERPSAALIRGGVEYVELRSLDLSPFDPVGMGQPQQKFLEAFILYCLLEDSPAIDKDEQSALQQNHLDVAKNGRKPGLELRRDGGTVALQDWATEICEGMRPVSEMLDTEASGGYVAALDSQIAAIRDPALTPSARLLADLRETGQPFSDYGLNMANTYRDYFAGIAAEFNARQDMLVEEATGSLQKQQKIEEADEMALDEYLSRYYA
jgi:glutamate--cysteine ligase